MIDRWDRDRAALPGASRIILTHTNDEVHALNIAARDRMRSGGQLGEDATLDFERGERSFAAGDRVMFLKNERELGVKNGTLGSVQSVTQTRMAVMLDDGRSVAFDVKDYAHVDHGYAATVHKSQGVTADRVHVLATPGLDRHAAYVAMSRHRDSVDLHYGRDDFSDQSKLVRALSRERGKDMASDYERSPEPEKVPAAAPQRSRFADLRLRIAPVPASAPARTPLDLAVERYARTAADIIRMRRQGLEPLAHQSDAYNRAAAALNDIRPEASRDLRAALTADRSLIDQAASGKTAGAIRAMTLEAEIRVDTGQRADRFVAEWQQKTKTLERVKRVGDYDQIDRARDDLTAMAKSLHRDPQLELLLRSRRIEFGIGKLQGQSLSHDLQEVVSLSRSRGIGR